MLPGQQGFIKLSELSHRLEDLLREHFAQQFFWVVAEVSGHKFYPSNARHYFEFVEKAEGMHEPVTKFRCVAWSAGSDSIQKFEAATLQRFGNGIQVLAKVKIEYHAVHGLSLVLLDIDQFFTLGNLEKQRLEILHRLVTENADAISKIGEDYQTKNKKLLFGTVIQKLAIIGSPNSEGFVDFMHTLAANQYGYTFTKDIFQSSVQGQFAEQELVQTLVSVYESNNQYDAVIIIRGGGAKTDFLVFDTYRLARAVARFPIPVITGIGHHKDVSITDMMAHTATKTPTKAAEFIIGHNRRFEDSLRDLRGQIIIKTQQVLAKQTHTLTQQKLRLVNTSRVLLDTQLQGLQKHQKTISTKGTSIIAQKRVLLAREEQQLRTAPLAMLSKQHYQIRTFVQQLKSASRFHFSAETQRVLQLEKMIAVMHPDNVLKKGFAIISKNGVILSDADAINKEDDVKITMEKFEFVTFVKEKTKR